MTENEKSENKMDKNVELKHELSTKEAYFTALNEWVKQANLSQTAMAMFPWYLMNSYPQLFQQQQQQQLQIQQNYAIPAYIINNNTTLFNNNNNNNNNNNVLVNNNNGINRRIVFRYRILGERAQADYIQQHGGFEYVIAPFWKRAVAEMLDILILLLLKIILALVVMNVFDLDLGLELNKDSLQKLFDEDAVNLFAIYLDFFLFSSDLLLLEMLTKVLVCFYEAILTTYFDGATLGKRAMGISIKHIEAMLPLPQAVVPPGEIPGLPVGWHAERTELRALLFPAETPSFYISMFRAFAKNIIMTLLFPMCFIMMFFKHNRTVYDMVAKTIVVEHNPHVVLRRP